ncbi:MAG TPA: hypothetical protein VNZ47_14070 [Candidatus Dormibacteraeota bacterium]|jgi:hypothetical protein|nr:hypothetical protein [Candidatus Dormibacteraeota bacterium]
MSLLAALPFFDIAIFGVALFAFAWLFNRFSGREDTDTLALTMHEINTAKPAPQAAKAKARAAGAA